MIVPTYILALVPVLTAWWTHRRVTRQEYRLCIGSVTILMLSLSVLAHFVPMACTWYGGPLAARGIDTIRIPLAVGASAVIAGVPIRLRLPLNLLAVLAGEIVLWSNPWMS
jgi:hypothetical protein